MTAATLACSLLVASLPVGHSFSTLSQLSSVGRNTDRFNPSNKPFFSRRLGRIQSTVVGEEENIYTEDTNLIASITSLHNEETSGLDMTFDSSVVVEPLIDNIHSSQADLMAQELVQGALQNQNISDFLMGGGETTEDSMMAEFLMGSGVTTDDSMMTLTNEENAGAVLEIAAEVEAGIHSEIVDSIPLIPKTPANDTMMDEMPEIVSAPSVVGEPETAEELEVPNVRKILNFAIPAIGVWLCNPLLSLIDTSAVGLLSGTVQQAALSPAVAITDYSTLLMAFLYTGTTNMVASAQEADKGVEGKPRTTKTFANSLKVSGIVGFALASFLFVSARFLVGAMLGSEATHPGVMEAAIKYVRIRSLGLPAAAVIGSAQAGCLGMQDIRSPMYVLVTAAVVNFIGDAIFVRSTNPLIGGAAGAAWATVFSQFAAVTFFINWLCNKPNKRSKVVNITDAIMELTGSPSSKGKSRRKQLTEALKSPADSVQISETRTEEKAPPLKVVSQKVRSLFRKKASDNKTKKASKKSSSSKAPARGILQGHFSGRDLLRKPSKEAIDGFAPYTVPVTTAQFGRVSAWISMSHVVSSSLGPINMAAQQVVFSLMMCLTPVADSLSLTAQSFVPTVCQGKPTLARAKAMRKLSKSFNKASAIFVAGMAAIWAMVPFIAPLCTSDPVVVAKIKEAVPVTLAIMMTHAPFCAQEGMLLGQKDLNFIASCYGVFFLAVPMLMLRVKRAALAGAQNISISTVWGIFLAYNTFRWLIFSGRISLLQRRREREAEAKMMEDSVAP